MHENYSARPHPEYVILDIGEDLGALIVYADETLHGSEIEISVAGADDTRSHKDVLERGIGDRAAFTAVFDRLPAGTYTLWSTGVPRARGVTVSGGAISELDWRTDVALAS
jgi:hypothetical protein